MFDLTVPGDLAYVLGPEILMMAGAMLLLVWAAWRPAKEAHSREVGYLCLLLTAVVLSAVLYYAFSGVRAGPGPVAADNFRWVSDVVILLGTIGTLLLSVDYNRREGIAAAEAHVLVLFAASGMMLLAAARDLMVVFLGIELMSIAVYVLVGLNRRSARSAEASLKYFLLGAFSTAFLLYGIALIYGATGTVNFEVMGARILQAGLPVDPMLAIGIGLLLIGFGFKVAAVPFHMWAPDVYEGAPTPITAFMAAAVKAAAFVALLRIFREPFVGIWAVWHPALWWIAAITMFAGNVIALRQRNIKRMLAYSSIAHAGYLLVAIVAGNALGSSALLFYVLAYTLASVGAFAVVILVGATGEPNLNISDYSGMWDDRPWLAVAMSIFMLALLGFPVFGGIGFFAKWTIFQAALESRLPSGATLAVVVAITSLISVGYYLYVVQVMFMGARPAAPRTALQRSLPTRVVVGAAAVLILLFGLFPGKLLQWSGEGEITPPPYITRSSPP